MSESHIILLPKSSYISWVKAAKKYSLKFGVNTSPDPVKAGQKQNITVAVVPNGYPSQGDIENWLKARFATANIDVIKVNTPNELEAELQKRILANLRYGVIATTPTPPVTTTPETPSGFKIYWPTDYPVITQGFAANPQIYSQWGLPGHEGLDIRCPMNTNVYAAYDGIVFKVEKDPKAHPYGIHIRIRHEGSYRTVYAHLAQVLVSEGDTVKAKQLIAKGDSTGNSTGSHLHLTLKHEGATARKETQFKGDVIDPTPFLVFPE
jgi:murein DD-endopeptidase MepM/ murein hydrolase activator NlpD